MKMNRYGLLTDRNWIGKAQSTQLLRKYLIQRGNLCDELCWENQNNWSAYDAVIISSPWNFEANYYHYLEVLSEISNVTLLLPSIDIVKKNVDKIGQENELRNLCLPTIPSIEIKPEWIPEIPIESICQRLMTSELVLKPNISASGHGVYLYSMSKQGENVISSQEEVVQIIVAATDQGKRIIAQPFMKNIEQGEVSMIFIGQHYSYSIVRYPGVLSKHKPSCYLQSPIPDSLINLGSKVTKEYLSDAWIHRVDCIMADNTPLIMEVECNEPDLFLFRLPDDKLKDVLSLLGNGINNRINIFRSNRNI